MELQPHPQDMQRTTQMQISVMAAGTSLCSDTTGTILVESSSSESAEGGDGDVTFDDGATCTDMEMATTAESGELTSGGGQTFYEMRSYSAASDEPSNFNLDALD